MFGMKRIGSQEPLTLDRIVWNMDFVEREIHNIIAYQKAKPSGYTDAILQIQRMGLWKRIKSFTFIEPLLDQMVTMYRNVTERDPFCNKLESQEIYASYLSLQRGAKQVTRRKHARSKNRRKSVGKRSTGLNRAGKTRRKKP